MNIFRSLVVLSFIFLNSSQAFADALPISESFSGSQPSSWEIRSSAAWAVSAGGDQTLLLTPNAGAQGGLGFYNASFPSNQGIVAEFTYYANEGDGADGLVFFLVDGDQVDESNIAAGALGGSLGYAQGGGHDGIPYAYLGVGFDEFGNFLNGNGGPGRIPNSVALRGSGNGNAGYTYLTSTNVASAFGYETDTGWRTARVTVSPGDGSALIRVEMSFDGGQTWKVVINDYQYNEAPPENLKLGFTASTGGSTNVHAIGNLTVTIPADLETALITSPSGTYRRGDSFTYVYSVINNGPNDSGTSTVINSMPMGDSGFVDLAWSYVTTDGRSASGDSTTIAAIPVDLPSGVTATVTVTGKIGKDVVTADDLYIELSANPGVGKNDPSPSSSQLSVDIVADVPTPEVDNHLDVIENYARTHGATTAPTVDDYEGAGLAGVTSQYLSVVNAAFAAYGIGAAITIEHAQNIISQAIFDFNHPVARISGGGGQQDSATLGCRDSEALNYNLFANNVQSLCVYKIATSTVVATSTMPARDLKLGMKGDDVKSLQDILITENKGPQAKKLAKVGASGNFGILTKNALIEYQKQNNILPASGYFGSLTKKAMKTLKLAGLWW